MSSFPCFSHDYQVRVQAGTALGEVAEVRWDTIELHRGDILLMVATSRHCGMPALPGSRLKIKSALVSAWRGLPRTVGLFVRIPNRASVQNAWSFLN